MFFKIGSFSVNKTDYFIEPEDEFKAFNDDYQYTILIATNNGNIQNMQPHIVYKKAYVTKNLNLPSCALIGNL